MNKFSIHSKKKKKKKEEEILVQGRPPEELSVHDSLSPGVEEKIDFII